jgi:hypothetical protein
MMRVRSVDQPVYPYDRHPIQVRFLLETETCLRRLCTAEDMTAWLTKYSASSLPSQSRFYSSEVWAFAPA